MESFGRLGSDYSQAVLDHFDSPVNIGSVKNVESSFSRSAAWGDELHLWLTLDGEKRVAELKWQCLGAPIVIAAASLASQLVVGWQKEQVQSKLAACLLEQLELSAEQRYAALFVADAIQKAIN
jgi:nitrogen fixation NifU-like protein